MQVVLDYRVEVWVVIARAARCRTWRIVNEVQGSWKWCLLDMVKGKVRFWAVD